VELQAQVAKYEGAQLVTKLDPRRIKQSKWKNRHELSYSTPEYVELKTEIEAAGGNVQPIKVRRVGKGADGQDEYEVVYGRRRLRACLELGLEVSAIVEEMDDLQLFTEMERENRSRADLSAWEQGVMYKEALDAKLFSSQRHMAAVLNVSQANLSMALALAALPEQVIRAFPSPLELQFRWASELTQALERDTARVITLATEIAEKSPRLPAKEVLTLLVSAQGTPNTEPVQQELKAGDKVVGSFSRDAKGRISVKLKAGALSAVNEKKLIEFVQRLAG
jgi:ParB family chromosome partitioning protein